MARHGHTDIEISKTPQLPNLCKNNTCPFYSDPSNGQKRWRKKKRWRERRWRQTCGFGSQRQKRGAECCCGRRRDGHLLGDPLSCREVSCFNCYITLISDCHTESNACFLHLSVTVYFVHACQQHFDIVCAGLSLIISMLNNFWPVAYLCPLY